MCCKIESLNKPLDESLNESSKNINNLQLTIVTE